MMLQNLTTKITIDFLYDFINVLSIFVLIGWVISQSKSFISICPHALKQSSEKRRWAVAAGEFFLISYSGVLLLFLVLNQKFGDWFTQGNKNYFGSLTAYLIMFIVIPIFLGISPLKSLDLFTPGLPLSLVVSKIACAVYGCCSSFLMPGSFYYNQSKGRYEFPVQMVEAGVALLLFFFLLWYRRRPHASGSVFPVYLITYSATRFFTEFFRADLPKVLDPFDSYQIMSVVFLIIGVLMLYIANAKGSTIDEYYEHKIEMVIKA